MQMSNNKKLFKCKICNTDIIKLQVQTVGSISGSFSIFILYSSSRQFLKYTRLFDYKLVNYTVACSHAVIKKH